MANTFNHANGFVPEIFSKKLELAEKTQTNFLNDMCNREWEGEIKQFGDTVHISLPDPANITIGTGMTPSVNNMSPTMQSLVINKTMNFCFKFTDQENAQSQFNLSEGYGALAVQKMADAHCLEIEQEVYNGAVATTIPAIGTTAVPIALTDATVYSYFVKLITKLRNNNAVGPNGYYTFKGNGEEAKQLAPMVTISPNVLGLLINASVLTHPSIAGDKVIDTADKKQVAGMDILVDTNLGNIDVTAGNTATSANQEVIIAGTKMGITYANQYSKVEKLRDPAVFQDIIRGLELYGFEIIHPKSLVVGVVTLP